MERFKESLKEIFEVDDLDLTAKINELDEWDSLSSLSVIALLDSDYGIELKQSEIVAFENLGQFCEYVIANKK
jgi:acyl carrier protein